MALTMKLFSIKIQLKESSENQGKEYPYELNDFLSRIPDFFKFRIGVHTDAAKNFNQKNLFPSSSHWLPKKTFLPQQFAANKLYVCSKQ